MLGPLGSSAMAKLKRVPLSDAGFRSNVRALSAVEEIGLITRQCGLLLLGVILFPPTCRVELPPQETPLGG